MIIDPLTFVPLEMDRRLAAARGLQELRSARAGVVRASRPRRRGVAVRLAAWATGRAAHA